MRLSKMLYGSSTPFLQRGGGRLLMPFRMLARLAANPRLAFPAVIGRPTYFFRFEIDGTQHHWAATFCYSQDETRIIHHHARLPSAHVEQRVRKRQ
jgi:hypothetical protein